MHYVPLRIHTVATICKLSHTGSRLIACGNNSLDSNTVHTTLKNTTLGGMIKEWPKQKQC